MGVVVGVVTGVVVVVGVLLLVLATWPPVASGVFGLVGWAGWCEVLRTSVRLSFRFGLFVTLGVIAVAIAALEAIGV